MSMLPLLKLHICFVEGRGVLNVGTHYIVRLGSCFQGIFQLIKETELSEWEMVHPLCGFLAHCLRGGKLK